MRKRVMASPKSASLREAILVVLSKEGRVESQSWAHPLLKGVVEGGRRVTYVSLSA